MLNTKLSALSWSIDHLWVVVVSLGVYLLTAGQSFRKDTGLLLVDYFLLAVGCDELSAGLSLFETF
jgi:predicted alpha/beta-fold hydrolase